MRYSALLKQLDGFTKKLGRTSYFFDSLALDWSGSGFEINVTCSRMCLYFDPYCAEQPAYAIVSVDGRESKYAVVNGTEHIILENLGNSRHTVSFIRITEGEAQLRISKIELCGETVSVDRPPEVKPRRIEFLGDSLTCGYGVYSDGDCTLFLTCDEDITVSYGYKTARHFDADVRFECISGQGLVRGCHGCVGYRIPEFFGHVSRFSHDKNDFKSWIPQIAVINAGTNDRLDEVSDEIFYTEALKFIRDVRGVYPDAEIIWFYGFMDLDRDAVLRRLAETCGDSKFHYLPVSPITREADEFGANGHPNLKGHERYARTLINFIEGLGGVWENE